MNNIDTELLQEFAEGIPIYTGCTASTAGKKGLIPAVQKNYGSYFFKGQYGLGEDTVANRHKICVEGNSDYKDNREGDTASSPLIFDIKWDTNSTPELYKTITEKGVNTFVGIGQNYVKCGCTFGNGPKITYRLNGSSTDVELNIYGQQGEHTMVCPGYTYGGYSSKHNITYTITGHSEVLLYDRTDRRAFNTLYSNGTNVTDQITQLDKAHSYDGVIDHYGGTTTVTCTTCRCVLHAEGAVSTYAKFYRYLPKVSKAYFDNKGVYKKFVDR